VNQQTNLIDKKVNGSTFAVGAFADAKAFQAFVDAMVLDGHAKKPVPFARAEDIDWKTHGVVVVVLKEHTNALHFKQWSAKDGVGELVFVWSGIEPYWSEAYPALVHKVDRKDLKKVAIRYTREGSDTRSTVGEIDFPAGKADARADVKKTILVEIKGKLERIEVPDRLGSPRDDDGLSLMVVFKEVWQITADGKTYELDFDSNKELREMAEKLNGKTVILTGRLEERSRRVRVSAGSEGSKTPVYMHVPYHVVVVTGLKAAEGDYVKQMIQVEVRGKLSWYNPYLILEAKELLAKVWTVTANGTTYELDFGGNKCLAGMIQKLEGKTVLVTGTLETRLEPQFRDWHLLKTGKPDLVTKHIIHVTDVQVVEAK
jgi:NAD-dependent DNA ligase